MAGQPDPPPRRDEPRQPSVRGARRQDEPRGFLARVFVDVQRVGADGGGQAGPPDVSRVAAPSLAPGEGPDRPRAPRQGQRLPRAVFSRDRPRRARGEPGGRVWTVFENGAAAAKLDLLLLGEGYAEKDLPKFHADVKRLVDILFTYEPFKSRKADFNVRALDLPASESGVLRPDSRIFRRTPLSVQYGIFGSERYVLTYDDRALREAASAAPYDFLEILVNDARYGGGGIFNFQGTASVDTGFSESVFVHEFGPHFAGLADEYYGSDVAYETGGAKPEPWEPNV